MKVYNTTRSGKSSTKTDCLQNRTNPSVRLSGTLPRCVPGYGIDGQLRKCPRTIRSPALFSVFDLQFAFSAVYSFYWNISMEKTRRICVEPPRNRTASGSEPSRNIHSRSISPDRRSISTTLTGANAAGKPNR